MNNEQATQMISILEQIRSEMNERNAILREISITLNRMYEVS